MELTKNIALVLFLVLAFPIMAGRTANLILSVIEENHEERWQEHKERIPNNSIIRLLYKIELFGMAAFELYLKALPKLAATLAIAVVIWVAFEIFST